MVHWDWKTVSSLQNESASGSTEASALCVGVAAAAKTSSLAFSSSNSLWFCSEVLLSLSLSPSLPPPSLSLFLVSSVYLYLCTVCFYCHKDTFSDPSSCGDGHPEGPSDGTGLFTSSELSMEYAIHGQIEFWHDKTKPGKYKLTMWNVCCVWERLVNPKRSRHIIETSCLNAFADEGLPKTGQAPVSQQQLFARIVSEIHP